MKRWPTSEVQLLERVVAWLGDGGWDVYQEVELFDQRGVCDIVAQRNGQTLAIEGKRSLGLCVLGQAEGWALHADAVAAAVPRWQVDPRWRRPAGPRLLKDACLPEHRDAYAAGSSTGGRVTPFKCWRAAVEAYVTENPGCTAQQIAAAVKHHYANDRTAASMAHRFSDLLKVERRYVSGQRAAVFFPAGTATRGVTE